jgi:hypothetical protein
MRQFTDDFVCGIGSRISSCSFKPQIMISKLASKYEQEFKIKIYSATFRNVTVLGEIGWKCTPKWLPSKRPTFSDIINPEVWNKQSLLVDLSWSWSVPLVSHTIETCFSRHWLLSTPNGFKFQFLIFDSILSPWGTLAVQEQWRKPRYRSKSDRKKRIWSPLTGFIYQPPMKYT